MRSHSSHRSSSSRRSSMHSSHRSGFSRSHSSMHRSSIHGSMHKSGVHRSSIGGIHKSTLKKHGISNAHAYTVGRATGVNINGSALGAHGAALHRFERMRKMSKDSRTRHSRIVSSFNRRHRGTNFNNRKSTDDFIKRMRVSHRKHRYTAPKYDHSQFNNSVEFSEFNEKINTAVNEFGKYIWIPVLVAIVFFSLIVMAMMFFTINLIKFR